MRMQSQLFATYIETHLDLINNATLNGVKNAIIFYLHELWMNRHKCLWIWRVVWINNVLEHYGAGGKAALAPIPIQ